VANGLIMTYFNTREHPIYIYKVKSKFDIHICVLSNVTSYLLRRRDLSECEYKHVGLLLIHAFANLNLIVTIDRVFALNLLVQE